MQATGGREQAPECQSGAVGYLYLYLYLYICVYVCMCVCVCVCVCLCVLERNRVCECSTDYVAWVYHRERGRKAEGGLGGRGKEAETETGAEKQRG